MFLVRPRVRGGIRGRDGDGVQTSVVRSAPGQFDPSLGRFAKKALLFVKDMCAYIYVRACHRQSGNSAMRGIAAYPTIFDDMDECSPCSAKWLRK